MTQNNANSCAYWYLAVIDFKANPAPPNNLWHNCRDHKLFHFPAAISVARKCKLVTAVARLWLN